MERFAAAPDLENAIQRELDRRHFQAALPNAGRYPKDRLQRKGRTRYITGDRPFGAALPASRQVSQVLRTTRNTSTSATGFEPATTGSTADKGHQIRLGKSEGF